MKKTRIHFAAKAAVLAITVLLSTTPAHAGIPVIDGTNLSQNIMTALESVNQTLKQIQQYSTQLQQYENQLQNTLAPASYIWDQAQATIADLQRATDTLGYYKGQLGSLDNYLSKFQNVNYYRNRPCLGAAGCSALDRAALDANSELASEALKKANDAMFLGLDQQQANLTDDADQLRRLQLQAQGTRGQMQAIGLANQLASAQSNQLLQIRSLLIAQQNAAATRASVDADKEAQRAAATKALRTGTLRRGADAGLVAW